jgi:UDP-2,3-diacylglucosamine pyrophosphatase LpxH
MDATWAIRRGTPLKGRSNRTLFLSDVHLAIRRCRADVLLDFLGTMTPRRSLVGDIVDFWRIKRGAIWPQSHSEVVQGLLNKMRSGPRLVFVPGNHNEGLRERAAGRGSAPALRLQEAS